MAKSRRIKLDGHQSIDAPVYEHHTQFTKEQIRFCLGGATPPVSPKTFFRWVCPRCGGEHHGNYQKMNGEFICFSCRKVYCFPREGRVTYTPPDILDPTNKITIENPDWL